MKKSLTNKTFESLVKEDKLIEIVLSSYSLDQSKLDSICEHLIFK